MTSVCPAPSHGANSMADASSRALMANMFNPVGSRARNVSTRSRTSSAHRSALVNTTTGSTPLPCTSAR